LKERKEEESPGERRGGKKRILEENPDRWKGPM